MEKKNQEHLQELESLRQKSSIDKQSLEHNAKLKKQQAEVGGQLGRVPGALYTCRERADNGVWL